MACLMRAFPCCEEGHGLPGASPRRRLRFVDAQRCNRGAFESLRQERQWCCLVATVRCMRCAALPVAIDTDVRRQRCQGMPLRYWGSGHSKKSARFFGVRCFRIRRRMRVRSCPIDVFNEPSPLDASRMNGDVVIKGEYENVEGATLSGQYEASRRRCGCPVDGPSLSRVWSLARAGPIATRMPELVTCQWRVAETRPHIVTANLPGGDWRAPPAPRSTAAAARQQVARAFSSRGSCVRHF